MTEPVPELMTPREAAAILRIEPKSLGRWADANLIRHTRLPSGHRRYHADHVREIAERMRGES